MRDTLLLENRDKNTVGKNLINLINKGKMINLGPHFPIFFSHNSTTNPDKIFSNKHHYLNCICEPGELTSSDHLPVIFKHSTTPFITETQKVYQTHKADWELFKHKLHSQISVTNLDNNSVEQLENATKNWIKMVKNVMDTAIPISTYKFTYQLKTHLK